VSRSRFVDYAPQGSRVSLHRGDIDLFLLLQEFPYLPLPYIGELLGHSKKIYDQGENQTIRYPSLRARLSRLRKDGGYLRCPEQSWRAANSRYRPAVYALTDKAKEELKQRGLSRQSLKLSNEFAHDLGACLVSASFKLGVRDDPALRLINAAEIIEHPACPPTTREAIEPFVMPVSYQHRNVRIEGHREHDWPPFGVALKLDEGRERKILFAGIEFDRRTEPLETSDVQRASLTRHLLSILALLEYGYERHFGTGRFFVPIVTIGEVRMRSVIRLLLKLTERKGSKHILFKHVDDFATFANFPAATGHMLTVPWERAGYPPLSVVGALNATA
jgi:hypothetical protein